MIPDDIAIVVFRALALVGFAIAFGPSVRRIATSETPAIRRTRIALAVLVCVLGYVQTYAIVDRLTDATPWWGGYTVSAAYALAGVVCAWSFWPYRRSGD